MATLALDHLGKTFPGNVRAVDNLSLEVGDAELLVLMGPSGCGKTTTLRMIAGLERPTSGNVVLDGRPANDWSPKDRDVALVFQQPGLFPHLSVHDNLAFGLKLRKVNPAEAARRIAEAARMLGIGDILARRPGELSGGQQQRVALGRALVRQPKVFLFDEPLASLDAALRVQLRQEIRRLHARLGVPMIYVTHDPTEAMALGQRIAMLREGRLEQVADPLTLYDRPCSRFVAAALGATQMNFLGGDLMGRDGATLFLLDETIDGRRVEIPLPISCADRLGPHADRRVTLGIRPEHLRIHDLSDASNTAAFPARVEAVERLGAESLVYLKAGKHSLVVQVPQGQEPIAGATVGAVPIPDRLHFFDPVSERSIAWP